MNALAPTRRGLLLGAGSLVIPFLLPPLVHAADAPAGGPAPGQLDTYLAIGLDGEVTVFFGKIDGGQGLDVAIAQIVAEELDVAPGRVRVEMGDTATSVNQGGASNASGISQGAVPLRLAAAEARLVLMERAAEKLGVPMDRLRVSDGVISVDGNPAVRTTYGALAGHFDTPVAWNGKYGNDLNVKVRATPKPAANYTLVGTPQPRSDIPAKVFARYQYVTDVRVPGMLHARMIRPPVNGALPTAIDAASIADIPGAQIVHKQGFLAVLAPREWRHLAVTWSDPPPAFPEQAALYDHIRAAPVVKRGVPQASDAIEPAMQSAARVITAEYRWPFQSHSSMGPACAVADVRSDGFTLWTGSQKPHYARDGVAKILGVDPASGRAIWRAGPGSYGRNDAGDAVIDAALLSREVGKPVRVQYMRGDGHAWDAKSPASVHTARAGLDAKGSMVAATFTAKSFSRLDVASSEADPRDSLASQLKGGPLTTGAAYLFPGEALPLEAYRVDAKQVAWEVIAPLLDRASQLRTSHLRDPLGPELMFAGECFVDELAAATGADALEYRLRHLTNERDVAVLKAAAQAAGWEVRPSGPRGAQGDVVTGRGIALGHRDGTFVGTVAQVTVDRRTGAVRVIHLAVAHDCGLIVNPDGIHRCVENAEAPQSVQVVLINRPTMPPTGAGEPSVRTAGAAIGNAIFDATGVRLRQAPFTPARVLAALRSA